MSFDTGMDKALNLVERVMKLEYFLFIFSVALFADTYLLGTQGTAILKTDDAWLKAHSGINEIMIFLGCAGFFYAVIVPGVLLIVGFIQIFLPNREFPRQSDGWVRHSDLRDFAVANSNSLAYQEYERSMASIRRNRHLSLLCLSIIILSISNYYIFSESHLSIIRVIAYYIETSSLFLRIPIYIIGVPFLFFLFIFAVRPDAHYDDHVFLPDFKNWLKHDKRQKSAQDEEKSQKS